MCLISGLTANILRSAGMQQSAMSWSPLRAGGVSSSWLLQSSLMHVLTRGKLYSSARTWLLYLRAMFFVMA